MIEHRAWCDWPRFIQHRLRKLVAARPEPGASWVNGDDAMAITALNDPEVWVDTFVLWSGDMPYYRPAFWFSVEVGWAVVGWAMAARSKHCPNATPEVSIFVQPEYRGFGFATKLFDRVMLAYLNVIVSIWDERSDRFYRRMDERYDGRVTIMNYWQGADR